MTCFIKFIKNLLLIFAFMGTCLPLVAMNKAPVANNCFMSSSQMSALCHLFNEYDVPKEICFVIGRNIHDFFKLMISDFEDNFQPKRSYKFYLSFSDMYEKYGRNNCVNFVVIFANNPKLIKGWDLILFNAMIKVDWETLEIFQEAWGKTILLKIIRFNYRSYGDYDNNYNFTTLLHQACAAGDLDSVEKLLKLSEQCSEEVQWNMLSFQDSGGYTPLHWAADKEQPLVLQSLLLQAKDRAYELCGIKTKRFFGDTPRDVASKKGGRCVVLLSQVRNDDCIIQ